MILCPRAGHFTSALVLPQYESPTSRRRSSSGHVHHARRSRAIQLVLVRQPVQSALQPVSAWQSAIIAAVKVQKQYLSPLPSCSSFFMLSFPLSLLSLPLASRLFNSPTSNVSLHTQYGLYETPNKKQVQRLAKVLVHGLVRFVPALA